MVHFRISKLYEVKQLLLMVILWFICIASSLFCGNFPAGAQSASASQMPLPQTWIVYWYQWELPDQIILHYLQSDVNNLEQWHTVRFNTKTGSNTLFHLTDDIEESLSYYGRGTWQISPNREWLLGSMGYNHIAVKIDEQRQVKKSLFAFDAYWMPDSLAWIESKQEKQNTLFKITVLSDAPERQQPPPIQYSLQGNWSLMGCVALDQILLVSHIARNWTVSIVSLQDKAEVRKDWKLRIPELFTIREGAISPDRKHICWLALCRYGARHKPGSPSLNKLDATIWVSSIDGTDLRRIATIELKDMSTARYERSRVWEIPRSIQWTPDNRKVSFLWQSHLWIVDIP